MNPLIAEMQTAQLVMCGKVGSDGRPTRLLLFASLYIYMLIECILALCNNWPNIDKRVLAIEDTNALVTCLYTIMELLNYPENFKSVYCIVNTDFMNDDEIKKYYASNERDNLIRKYNENIQSLRTFVDHVVRIIVVCFVTPSGIITIYKIYIMGITETIDFELPSEFAYYTTSFIMKPNIFVYVFVYILQAVCLINLKYVATLVYISAVAPIEKLKLDMNLLIISIKMFDEYFNRISREKNINAYKEDNILFGHLSFLVSYHDFIIRQTRTMNEAVRFTSLTIVQAMCMQFCLYLYCFTEVPLESLQKFKYMCVILLSSVYFYAYNNIGEEFIRQGEMLYAKLYEATWYEKPAWIKRTFLLMMSQAAHPLEIKPMGLFVIGMKSFTNVLNTAYSAFNVLRNSNL